MHIAIETINNIKNLYVSFAKLEIDIVTFDSISRIKKFRSKIHYIYRERTLTN